jgi:hypothetical protein
MFVGIVGNNELEGLLDETYESGDKKPKAWHLRYQDQRKNVDQKFSILAIILHIFKTQCLYH